MPKRTIGQAEAEISEAIVKFEREYMGRGPTETKTYILKDMVFVRLKGVLTPAEEQLAKNAEGATLIKKTRAQLLENARGILEAIIVRTLECRVVSLHTDVSTRTGERIIVFTVDADLEGKFAQKKVE